jgi:3',5'-cyclic AMP phosphodiesterase CpdA
LHHADAARVIVTGDLTRHGDEISYRLAKAALYRLQMPETILVGNHDRRCEFSGVFADVPL